MKKLICLFGLIAVIFSFQRGRIFAQSSTDSATASVSAIPEDATIKQLKEKVANKVAEMRKKDQKAVSGVITSVKDNTLVISTTQGIETMTYEITLDGELTQFYAVSTGVKKELKTSDLKVGNYIIVAGPIVGKTIQANMVYVDERYIVKSGTITEINTTDFSFKVLTLDKSEYAIDIESSTSPFMMNIKTSELEKTGFSKVKEGDTIHFVGVLAEGKKIDSKVSITAKKYIIIPQEYFIK